MAARAEPAAIGPFVVLRKLGEGAMGVVYAGYDVALDRKVALKLVRPQLLGHRAVRERMLREAQAMARLSDPHVVQVYAVGEHGRSIYLAMEYVDGQTLASWLRAEERPWPAILRTICDAGRGLAAAHAAGFVHRDFKPDNVLVDAQGRARVLDFGLVHAGGPADEDAATVASQGGQPGPPADGGDLRWSEELTQKSIALGTPAYMSPEQHFGLPVGPYSDQFSFAATLYEALYGERPFSGLSWAEIRAKIQRGVVPPPARPRGPRRLFKVIARGLARRPEERWPSVDAMIDALEREPWRPRARGLATLALLGAVSAASYAAARPGGEVARCEAAGALTGVWDGARAAAVERAFAATDAPFSADALRRVRGRLDAYASAWSGASRAVCEASADRSESARLLDLRLACLGRRRAHLAALVDVFEAADRDVVEHAVQAVAALPGVQACADADALLGGAAPPDDPRLAARVEALRGLLARATVLEDTGRFEEGQALAAEVRGEAAELGYAPLRAEAALCEGRLHIAAARAPEAESALVEAMRLAIEHDLHAITAEAAARRIFVIGEGLGRLDEALAAAPIAEAWLRRARDDGRLAALLHNNLGIVHDLRGDLVGARAHYTQAIEVLEGRPGPIDPLVAITHNNLGNMVAERGDAEGARAHFTRARALFTQLLGEGHPFVAHALAGLADADALAGDDEAAIRSYLRALDLMEASYGVEHRYLLQPLTGLGEAFARRGELAAAERHFARAVAIADDLERDDPMVAPALEGLASLAYHAGDTDRARALYGRAAAIYEAGDPEAASRVRGLAAAVGEASSDAGVGGR